MPYTLYTYILYVTYTTYMQQEKIAYEKDVYSFGGKDCELI
jgi:hypothetical protein